MSWVKLYYVLDPRGWQLAAKGIYEFMNWQRAGRRYCFSCFHR